MGDIDNSTPEELSEMEKLLHRVDPMIEQFAATLDVAATRNRHHWPERSVSWGQEPRNIVQLYLADPVQRTWHLWIASSQDRGQERYWRQERLVDSQPLEMFEASLPGLLDDARRRLAGWGRHPETFELAGPVVPL